MFGRFEPGSCWISSSNFVPIDAPSLWGIQVRLQLTGECNPAKPTLTAREIGLVARRLAATEGHPVELSLEERTVANGAMKKKTRLFRVYRGLC